MSGSRPLLFLACTVAALVLGCRKIPAGEDAVTAISVRGVPSRYDESIEAGLTTKATKRLLWVISGVYEWQTLDEEALETDIERIRRELKRRGYYEARVTGVRVLRRAENKVDVEIDVEPGPRVMIGKITTEGLASLPFDVAVHATRSLDLREGDPFDETEYENVKLELANALADVGYAHVKVGGRALVDLSTHRATVTLLATPGPRATFGPIAIEGLEKIDAGPVRTALALEEGAVYSRRSLEEARLALFRLGVFSRVDVVPLLSDSKTTVVPITVRLEEGAMHSITAGAGASLDVLRFAVHGRVSWVSRNFLGGLRELSLDDRPGLTFFPTRIDYWRAPTNVLPENSLTATLKQPSFLESRTLGVLETGYNVYPLLYPLPADTEEVTVNPAEEQVVGYQELTARPGLQRTFLNDRLPVSFFLNWRSNFPFYYQGTPVEGLEPVTVTYPEFDIRYDLRDDPIAPTKGIVLSNNLQVALPLVSPILDLRIRPEARAYVPLDFRGKTVLALRFTAGFLFPSGYGSTLSSGTTPDFTNPDTIRDQHALLFRAFYSGGPSSNRGYPYQRIGPQGPIGFLLPTGTQCQGASVDPACLRPLGGFTLWEASIEVRRKLGGPWGLVLFADASDVAAGIAEFNWAEPHLSIGTGLRYASPIGPIRLDLGWRVPGMQKLDGPSQGPPDVSEVAPYVDQSAWNAFAFSVLIGEAF